MHLVQASMSGEVAAVMAKWECIICGHIYDEALGDPENGVPAGTAWADVPASWLCPDCGVGKEDFVLLE
jgi:rubredoxin